MNDPGWRSAILILDLSEDRCHVLLLAATIERLDPFETETTGHHVPAGPRHWSLQKGFGFGSQREVDSILQYMVDLGSITQHYDFAILLHCALRDKLVCGLSKAHHLSVNGLTVDRAMAIAVAMYTATNH